MSSLRSASTCACTVSPSWKRAFQDPRVVEVVVVRLLGVQHFGAPAVPLNDACVADLSARLGVERRAVQHNLDGFACLRFGDEVAPAHESDHLRLAVEGFVADELGGAGLLRQFRQRRARLHEQFLGDAARFAGALTLRRHRPLEALHINGEARARRRFRASAPQGSRRCRTG
jgi:hypothetical protein